VKRRDAGFTLLEVLVALAILGIAVVASIQGFAQGLRLLKVSGEHQQAMLIADEKAREVVTPVPGQEEGTEGVYTWQRITKAIEVQELVPEPTTREAGTPPQLRGTQSSSVQTVWKAYEIVVHVRWAGRHVEIATVRTAANSSEESSSQ
jgi:general secretion pathway protein I